jgi:2-amino-4-hydroxy-6-hydroxymethyldihydropteridine diphosphokinase
MEHVYLLTGANLGNRLRTLQQAQQLVAARCGVVVAVSAVYETAAWGKQDQPDFLNQVVVLATDLSATALLTTLLAIEQELGRVRTEKWSERTIDIDILYYGDLVLRTDVLTVPHPLIEKRRFALLPLCEVAPDLIHPVLRKTTMQLLELCTDSLLVTRL